jgi:hypothetical protein
VRARIRLTQAARRGDALGVDSNRFAAITFAQRWASTP